MAAHEVFVAVRNFNADDDYAFEVGQRVSGDCPHIQTHPQNFERLDRYEAKQRIRAAYERGSVEQEEGQTADRSRPEMQRALRVIDSATRRDVMRAEAADRLEEALGDDVTGHTAGYFVAHASAEYKSAFGKVLQDPVSAPLRFTLAEADAFRVAVAARSELTRSLQEASTGAYGVPIELDPSIMLTSAGALNPIRSVAKVRSITSNIWKGVTSTGITASYDQESTEVSDDTPTLLQPTGYAEAARAFVPYSIETGQDWPTLQDELLRMLSDAKDVLESTMFLSGLGHASYQPQGLFVGATLITSTAAATTLAAGDIYTMLEAVPARFRPRATVLASPTMFDKAYRATPAGSVTEPQLMPDRGGPLLGLAKYEWSDMPTTLASGGTIFAAGDFSSAFSIFDRVGLAVEVVPHLLGSSGRRPTGERGLFAYWRSGAIVTNMNAIRSLKVT
jgi:HK97 family phage major capsid protein